MPATAWPADVVARYLTLGGATVDVTDTGVQIRYGSPERTVHAHCTGTGCTHTFAATGRAWYADQSDHADLFTDALRQLNEDAQAHAETCRAMPRPA